MENYNDMIMKDLDKSIEKIVHGYVKVRSFTNTKNERENGKFLTDYVMSIPYFKEHPELCGLYPIEGDPLNRESFFAMVKGEGDDTVVFVHHNDVVSTEDFKRLKNLAFSPEELEKALKKKGDMLPDEAVKDLYSGEFIFGRGMADMKGGGSIQLALLERYSAIPDFKGNIIVIAVPDEENLSAGMRSAVKLLSELQDKYSLKYKMMINSEPHQRKDEEIGMFSEGSVGKIMPFVYARGSLAHVGKVFEGLNPLNMISEVVRRGELNMDLTDVVDGEAAPPPTWLYLKDEKEVYDVSMPIAAAGCLSVLTLNRTPREVLDYMRILCHDAFEQVIKDTEASYEKFTQVTNPVARHLRWEVRVSDFSQLYQEAVECHGEEFEEAYREKGHEVAQKINKKEISMIEANFELVRCVYDFVDDLAPRMVFGLLPPYYPNVCNQLLDDEWEAEKALPSILSEYTKETFNQEYVTEHYYTGISDLSYASIRRGKEVLVDLKGDMPLFGEFYDLSIETIEKISMPCINIGPWGKAFHKMTERVYKEDLYHRTPQIINKAISVLLDNDKLV